MKILSNEEKLDIFFNYLKDLNPKDLSPIIRNGFNSAGLKVDPQECDLYIERFKLDGLIEQRSRESFIITLKGHAFQGYNTPTLRVKKSIDKVWLLTFLGLIVGTVGTYYTVASYYKPNQTEVQLQLTLPIEVKIDSLSQVKRVVIDTSVIVTQKDSTNLKKK